MARAFAIKAFKMGLRSMEYVDSLPSWDQKMKMPLTMRMKLRTPQPRGHGLFLLKSPYSNDAR